MKKLIVVGVILLAVSCHKEEFLANSCQVKYPLEELGWMRDSINRYMGQITVSQAMYHGQTVFSIDSYSGVDAGVATLYQCDGSVLCKSYVTIAGQSGNCNSIWAEVTNRVVIYRKDR